MENNKLKLLIDICRWYGYDLVVNGEDILSDSHWETVEYKTVEEGLKEWLITLKHTNRVFANHTGETIWKDKEIELIESL